ncbi:MAG: hypothetical protein KF891_09755 [Rhizobacter sp.]|nr:hypothetical protein [Rhizobacter sp.]
MWKIVVGFVIVAGLALWLLSKGGDVDMSGEKHSVEAAHPASTASAPASAASQ